MPDRAFLDAWTRRQVGFCLASGCVTSKQTIRVQPRLAPTPEFPAGRYGRSELLDGAEPEKALRERFGEHVQIEWRSGGSFFFLYSPTKIHRQQENRPMMPTVTLSPANMGAVTDTDWEDWTRFVVDKIDERCGFDVGIFYTFSLNASTHPLAGDEVSDATDDQEGVIKEAIQSLWEEWCSEPQVEAEVEVEPKQMMLKEFAKLLPGCLFLNDAGNGSSGPACVDVDELWGEDQEQLVEIVTEEENPEAWRLARRAVADCCGDVVTLVAVSIPYGSGADHRTVFAG